MPEAVRVLSIQTRLLGNKTFGDLLRRAYRDSTSIDFRAFWGDEGREFHARVLNRFLMTRPPGNWIRDRNLDFFPARYEIATSYMARRLLRRILPNVAPDVLHFHTQGLALLSTDIMRKMPTVITADRTAMLTAHHQTADGWHWTYKPSTRLESEPLRCAAAVVTFSKWAADSMAALYGIPADRLHVVSPGVDLELMGDIDVSRRSRDGVKRILFVGGEFSRKGGPLLVDVFLERFARDDVELHLVTTEDGIPVHPKIVVHRGVEAYSARWKRLYEEADLFVMPSARDALGHVYLEAMAAQLPVIGLDLGAMREMVVEGETGFLVPRDDRHALAQRIGTLLDDESLRRRLGANGRARVEHLFDAGENLAKLERIFMNAARSSNGWQRSERTSFASSMG